MSSEEPSKIGEEPPETPDRGTAEAGVVDVSDLRDLHDLRDLAEMREDRRLGRLPETSDDPPDGPSVVEESAGERTRRLGGPPEKSA